MKLPHRRWFVIIAGAAIFLAAFGIAFAATWFQGSQVVSSTVNVQTTVVISGDQMFALWRDEAMTEPMVSGDGPHITFLKVENRAASAADQFRAHSTHLHPERFRYLCTTYRALPCSEHWGPASSDLLSMVYDYVSS